MVVGEKYYVHNWRIVLGQYFRVNKHTCIIAGKHILQSIHWNRFYNSYCREMLRICRLCVIVQGVILFNMSYDYFSETVSHDSRQYSICCYCSLLWGRAHMFELNVFHLVLGFYSPYLQKVLGLMSLYILIW